MQNLQRIISAAALGLAMTACMAASAKADTTYSYMGNPFTDYNGESCVAPCHLTGSFEVATALAANLVSAAVTPVTYSYTDGTRPISPANDGGFAFFRISTDSSGMIDGWDIELGNPFPTTATILSLSGGGSGSDNETYDESGPHGFVPFGFESNTTAGVWTISATNSGVPEPSSLTLLGVGLMGSAWALKKSGQ
jgi:hypothetical protein